MASAPTEGGGGAAPVPVDRRPYLPYISPCISPVSPLGGAAPVPVNRKLTPTLTSTPTLTPTPTLTLTPSLTATLTLTLTLSLSLALALTQGEHPARPSPARLVQAEHRHACDVEAPAWLAQLGDARERGMQQQGRRREGRDRGA